MASSDGVDDYMSTGQSEQSNAFFNIGMCIRDAAGGGNRHTTKMDVGEVIVYGRVLKTKERKSVESYLSKKWNVKI